MFSVNYVNPSHTLEFDQRESGPGNSILTQSIDTRSISINDIRNSSECFSIEKQGFMPVEFSTAFTAFDSDEAITRDLYPEVEKLLAQELESQNIIIFDHTYRSSVRTERTVHNRAPVKTVHNDYTASSAKRMVNLKTANRPELRGMPYQFINIWLPVLHEVEESPLAFIDLASVSEDDFKTLKLIYPDRVGEISGIAYNTKHRWFYQSRMKPGEAMLFKVFDSRSSNNIVGVPHSAVDSAENRYHNNSNIKTRQSIEFRAIVFKESL